MIKVFFDASVILSSIISSSGYSFKLVDLAKKRKITGVVSETIVEEVKRNLEKIKTERGGEEMVEKYFAGNNFIILEKISEEDIKPYELAVEKKDAHVFFAALFAKCEFLATLDKKHIDNKKIKKHFSAKIKIGSPHEIFDQIQIQPAS